MKQKIFLTSALAMGVIAPAIAEPSNTGTFPTDGLMQADYTYTNAATSTNMDGVYSGTVNAVAEYDIIDYIVNAGQYLPADSETVITCPAGSFCPGISGNVQYNQTTPQGIQTCPTGYASSAAGASSDTECYRQCSGNVTIEHATGVTGNDYYGNGTDTCEPTDCVNGWHVKDGFNLTSTFASFQRGSNLVYRSNSGTGSNSSAEDLLSAYGITQNGEFAVDYQVNWREVGTVYGSSICSTVAGDNNNQTWTNPTIISNLTDESGQTGAKYCYCRFDSYTPVNGSAIALSGPWVYYTAHPDSNSDAICANNCTFWCAQTIRLISDPFLDAMLRSVAPTLASCEANTITINWSDVDPEYAGQNNEGTAVYGEDVRTPVKAATKKGQTFRGWRFSKPESVSVEPENN